MPTSWLKVSSLANGGDHIVVGYNSGMLAEFCLSRHTFTFVGGQSLVPGKKKAMSSAEWQVISKVMQDPMDSYSRLEVCDSIIVKERACNRRGSTIDFIHRYSFETLGSLNFDSSTPWDYQNKRFVHKNQGKRITSSRFLIKKMGT